MANPFITFFNFVKGAWEAAKTLEKINMVLTAATLAVGVKGFMQQRAMMAKGQDILAQKTAAGGKLPVVYGNRRIGSQVIFMDTASNNSTHLYVVYALSVGELEEINLQTLEIDGNPLTDSNQFRNGGYLGSDKISSGAGSLCTANQNSGSVDLTGGTFGTNPALGGYRYVFNAHHGAATQVADPMLRASIGSKWTTAHKLNGVAFISASFIYDSKGQFSGVPQITVQVKGKKVYDQRKDSTNGGTGTQRLATPSTYGWSDNPAIIFQDYILNSEYGKGIPSSQINFTTFTTAANKADTEVDQPYFNGTAKALTWSGNAGDNFITILGSEESWWQNKVGELLSLFDANGNNVLDAIEITEARRNGFFDESSVDYKVFIGATLSQTYSSQNGTSLVKVKRFHCNGYLDANKNVMDNAKDLLANMRGIFLYIDGKYELQIEDTGSSTFNISDDHIIADAGINIDYGNKDKKANKVIVEFFNANKKYELDTATVFHSAVPNFTSDDGNEELEIKAEFSYITDPYIAHNMAKAILTRSRNQTTIQFLGTPEMYKLNVGDIVNVTYSGLSLNGRIFRVEALELQANGLVSVSLIEYFDVYSWEVPPEEPVEALQDIPSAYAVKAPTNITFTDTDSSSTGRPFLAWDLPTDYPYYQWRINVKDSSGNQQINKIVDVNNCDLNFLPVDSNYIASITALNTMGVESSPSTLTFTIGDAPTRTPDIKDLAIIVDKLGDGSVTNIKVSDLSAAKINTGELNLGQASGMSVRQTKTGYTSTATGFWLGNDGGTPKFNIGSSTKFLKFDGTDLEISGNISATTGSIGGFTVGSTSLIAGTGSSRISLSTADGIHLGNNTFGSAPFRVSLAGALTATNATISGSITATSLNVTNATVTGTLDASTITVNGNTLSTLLGVTGTGTGRILTVGYDAKNQLKVSGTDLKYIAYDQTQSNGDLALDMDEDSAIFYPRTDRVSWTPTKIFGGDTEDNTNNAGIVTPQLTVGSSSLNASYSIYAAGSVSMLSAEIRTHTPTSTTNALYNVGGALYFNGAAVGGGTSTTINNNADNRIITGSGTANTLNAESGLTFNGTTLSGDAIQMTGNINASGVSANNVSGGLFKINSTTVIDASRNLINIPSLNVNHSSNLSGTQVYIKKLDANTNLQRWGEGTSGQSTYRFRIDQDMKFIANSGSGDKLTIFSSTGNLDTVGTISSGAITSTGLVTSVGGVINTNTGSNPFYVTRQGVTNQSLKIYTDDASAIFESIQDESLDNYGNFVFVMDSGATEPFFDVRKGSAASGSKFRVDGSGALQVGSANTTFLDPSRNLTNIGTISSGAITSTGILSLGSYFKAGTSVATGYYQDSVNGAYRANGTTSTRGFFFQSPSGASTTMYVGLVGTYAARVGVGTNFPSEQFHATGVARVGSLKIGATTVLDSSRNLTNINLVKFRDSTTSFYISPTNPNTLNAQHGITTDSADMWINYRGYADGFTKFRDFRIGNGKGSGLLHVDGSDAKFDFQNGSVIQIGATTVIDASRNLTNIGSITSGTISSGNITAYTTSADSIIDVKGNSNFDSVLRLRSDQGSIATEGFEIWYDNSVGDVHLNTTYPNDAASIHFQTRTGAAKSTANKRLTINGNGNVDIVTGSLRMGTTTVLNASREIQNVTFASALYTDEFGKSLVGNFGQFQTHEAYQAGFNASVVMWGWTYVQSSINAPNTSSSQWYRNRVSLGDIYGYNYDSNDYWLEMAHPRYTHSSAGHMWIRSCEAGNVGGWSQVGSNIIGNFTATGNVTAFSDERLKENIETLDSKKALQMRGVSFIKDGVEGSGVIAQEIEKIAPELVMTADDEMGTKSVAYGNLVGYLIETVKDQQKQIDELKQRISA